MGLISSMKNQINQSGGSKSKIFFVKNGSKRRVRFLQDAEEGLELTFHDSFEQSINTLCREEIGQPCPYCDREDLRTRKMYAWLVWDYDSNDVKILVYAANSFTPVPTLISLYETYETLLDRDYVIARNGEQQKTNYSVIPMDKTKFKSKVKPLSKKEMLKLIAKAFPINAEDLEDEDFEDEDEKPKKGKSSKSTKGSKKSKKPEPEPEPDFDDEDEDDEEEELDYEEMSAKELYKLCKERDIKCKPKKDEEYYIELLEEYDEEMEDDEEEEDDEDEWED